MSVSYMRRLIWARIRYGHLRFCQGVCFGYETSCPPLIFSLPLPSQVLRFLSVPSFLMHAPATVASFLLSENAGSQSAAYLPALYGEQCAIRYFKKGARSSGACIRDEVRCGGRMIRPWHASC